MPRCVWPGARIAADQQQLCFPPGWAGEQTSRREQETDTIALGRVSIAWPFLTGVRPAYPVLIIYLAFVQSPAKDYLQLLRHWLWTNARLSPHSHDQETGPHADLFISVGAHEKYGHCHKKHYDIHMTDSAADPPNPNRGFGEDGVECGSDPDTREDGRESDNDDVDPSPDPT